MKGIKLTPSRLSQRETKRQQVIDGKADYPACVQKDCPRYGRCLHARQYNKKVAAQCNSLVVLNPELNPNGDDGCRCYRDDTPVKYAMGFLTEYRKMDWVKQKIFAAAYHGCFRKTRAYDMLNGDEVITPADQQTIIGCAAQAGYDFPADGFDVMFEAPNW